MATMKSTSAALLLALLLAAFVASSTAQLRITAAAAKGKHGPPPKRGAAKAPVKPTATPRGRAPSKPPTIAPSKNKEASRLRSPSAPVERPFLRPPVPPYSALIPPGRMVQAVPPGLVRKAAPKCSIGTFLWPDNVCRTQRPPFNYFSSAVQGTIHTMTIFSSIASFEFASGTLTSINSSHVVVRTATGNTITGTLVTGSVVAPDVFVGGKVDMVTHKGNAITRVKLSEPDIMPVEIRKSFSANFTVLVNPDCTNKCATKTVSYESGTMAYIMGGNLTFCRDDMAARVYTLTPSTSYGDEIHPLTRDSLSRGVPIQVLIDSRSGMRVRTDATDLSPRLALSAIRIVDGKCTIDAPSSSYAITRI